MNRFVHWTPTKLLFGKGTVQEIGRETSAYGQNVLLVTGASTLKQNGLYSVIRDSLVDNGCIITDFPGVFPNPTLDLVKSGIEKSRSNGCDVICAAGGGSVIDTAKAISCGVPVKHDVWKFFTAKKKLLQALPVTVVSTVTGSGSENNSGMVITNMDTSQKFGYGNRILYPKVSILNPETTYSLSSTQTGYGAADIISHLIEFYCNNNLKNGILPYRLMESTIGAVIENCKIAQTDPDNYTARAELMWAASLALSGLFSAGLGRIGFPVHCIEHALSVRKNTPHGAGLAVLLPLWMRYGAKTEPEKIAMLGERLFGVKTGPPESRAMAAATCLQDTFAQLQCPTTLAELDITSDDLPRIASTCIPLAKLWRMKKLNEETVLQILSQT